MFIQTEATPNPATIKFLPNMAITGQGTREFKNAAQADGVSPLAAELFQLPGVAGVLLGPDFVAVTKDDARDWDQLKPWVLGAMMDHLVSGFPVLTEAHVHSDSCSHGSGHAADSSAIADEIIAILEERIRPAVAQDGGDVLFDRFEDGIVYLRMRGACSGCPSSAATLKHGIENMLKHFVPAVTEVREAV